jgi:hypothetical protein
MRSTAACAAAMMLLALCTSAAEAATVNFPSAFGTGARVDVNTLGQAVVAWDGPTGVRAVVGDRAGGLQAPVRLFAAADTSGSPQAAIDDRGDVIVVWETYRATGGGECSTCGPHLVSNGVWAAVRHSGSGFAAPVALAGPQRDTGAEIQLAYPRLAMSSTGHAVVAWSSAAGAMAASRSPGEEIGSPQRVLPAGFAVGSAAIAGDGEAFLADGTGRVAIRPAGGTFGTPALLPGSAIPYGPPALLAVNAAGDALAAYRGTRGVEVSRRAAEGGWGQPAVLTSIGGAAARAVALSDSGSGIATFAQITSDPWLGGRSNLLAATLAPGKPPAVEQVEEPDLDADMSFDGAGLDMDSAGASALAFNRSDGLIAAGVARLAYRPAPAALAAVGTLTAPEANRHAYDDGADVAFGAAGELLATWADHYPGEDRIMARWIGSGVPGPALLLDRAQARDIVLPTAAGHAAQLTRQPRRKPDRLGRILVGLRCLSFDGQPCSGRLKLTAGPRKWSAGSKRFAIAPGATKRIKVKLATRARRVVRRRGTITLTATAVTTASGGTFGGITARIVVRA